MGKNIKVIFNSIKGKDLDNFIMLMGRNIMVNGTATNNTGKECLNIKMELLKMVFGIKVL